MWSGKLGFPHAVSDKAIKVDLPADMRQSDHAGSFSDPTHLIARLRLARLSSSIIDSIYGSDVAKMSFSSRVQGVLTDMQKWIEGLPNTLKIDESSAQADAKVVSLHLSFNQVRHPHLPWRI
jgi:hypothetical protein